MDLTTLFKISYGVYIVGSKYEDKYSACIATTVMQVTSEDIPKLIAVINKENYTHELITKSKKLNISVLSEKADLPFIGRFGFQSGRNTSKLTGTSHEIGGNGVPIVTQNSVVAYETRVINELDVGTHTIFVLLLENAVRISEDPVLTYEYYHKVIKGGVPKTAATYVEPSMPTINPAVRIVNEEYSKYCCLDCGYIYDEEKEGVKFEDLPDDWVCPICKTPKKNFVKV